MGKGRTSTYFQHTYFLLMDSSQGKALFWIGFITLLGLAAYAVWGTAHKATTTDDGQVNLLVPVSESDHRAGPMGAPVTIVEYADFECPSCQAYAPVLSQLVKEYPQNVQFVYRYFPLPQHPNAVPSARAAEAAGLQGKFWEMHDLLFVNHAEWETQTNPSEVFKKYATQLGLDTARFETDYTSKVVIDRVSKDANDAATNKLSYTPPIFLNGVRIQTPGTYEALKAAVEAAMKPATTTP